MSAFEFGLGVQTLQIIGWALLHSLWIGAVIGVVFALLRHLVRDHISVRYWLGVGCLFAFASIEFGLFVNALLSAVSLPPAVLSASALVLSTGTPDSEAAVQQLARQGSTVPLTLLIGFAWLLGVGISAWRLLRSHRTLRLLAVNAQSDSYSELRRLCAPLLELLHLRSNVRFAVSELIDVPCVIGLFKPLVLLPAALLARMPQDQLELVLLHELSHIKSGDLWINSAQIVLEVLMFFHPVVHWISADIRATRERRCDRAVLKVRAAPVRYAHALVSLEEFRHEFRGLALSATGGELSSRVRDILASRTRSISISTRQSMRGAVLGSLAATVVLLGAVASTFMPRGVNDSSNAAAEPSSSAQVFPLAMNAAAVIANPALATASIAPFAPRRATPETRREPLATPTTKSQNTVAIARRVLATPKNRLAKASLPKQDFARLLAPVLLPIAALAESTDEPSAVQPPKVIARVQPAFAPGQHKLQAFTLSFSLDAAGIPQQISLARGQASRKQILAAQTALAQWRFEPKASAKFAGKRLEQSFTFQQLGSDRCSVGTRICR